VRPYAKAFVKTIATEEKKASAGKPPTLKQLRRIIGKIIAQWLDSSMAEL